jgi:hypothetical protein
MEKVECSQCDMIIRKANAKIHVKRWHEKIERKTLKCGTCGFTSETRHELKMHHHMARHRVRTCDHQCNLCPAKVQSPALLLRHIEAVHFNLKKWKCRFCDHSTNSKSNLTAHRKKTHKDSDNINTVKELPKYGLCNVIQKIPTFDASSDIYLDMYVKPFCETVNDNQKPQLNSSIHKQTVQNSSVKKENIRASLNGYIGDKDNMKKAHCSQCDMVIRKDHVKLHVKRWHSGIEGKTLQCGKCGFMPVTRHELKMHHNVVCHRVRSCKHQCSLCPAKVQSPALLLRHLEAVHFNLRKWKCMFCNHSTNAKSNLNAHVKRIHEESGKINPATKLPKDDLCHIVAKVKHFEANSVTSDLEMNGATWNTANTGYIGDQKKIINLCEEEINVEDSTQGGFHIDKVFSLNELVTGIDLSEGKQKHYQNTPDTTMSSELKKHHIKAKDKKCAQCDYVTCSNSHLNRHIKSVHEKSKDQKCVNCDYSTSTFDQLSKHVKARHMALKDKKCLQCDFSSSRADIVTSHVKAVHMKIKDKRCAHCNYATSRGYALSEHIKSIHSKTNESMCPHCNFAASNKNTVKRHVKAVHERARI